MAAPTRNFLKIARRFRNRRGMAAVLFLLTVMAVGVYQFTRPGTEELPAFPYGEIRVTVDASYPPFANATETGPEGLEIDLANALGERLDLPVRFINLGVDSLYASLTNDQADLVISTLVVDFWRSEVRYTRPYYDAGLVLVSTSNIVAMEDLPGKKLALEFGSTADAEARNWLQRIAPFDVLPYELPDYALDAVRIGIADAVLVDATSLRLYLREQPDWQPSQTFITHLTYHIATRRDRKATFTAVEAALGEMERDGTLAAIIARWL